jgi:hypothetical protein
MARCYIGYIKGYCGTSHSSEFYFCAIPCMLCVVDTDEAVFDWIWRGDVALS